MPCEQNDNSATLSYVACGSVGISMPPRYIHPSLIRLYIDSVQVLPLLTSDVECHDVWLADEKSGQVVVRQMFQLSLNSNALPDFHQRSQPCQAESRVS